MSDTGYGGMGLVCCGIAPGVMGYGGFGYACWLVAFKLPLDVRGPGPYDCGCEGGLF